MSSAFDRKGRGSSYSIVKTAQPRRGDALPFGTCRRCGFIADHSTPEDCIATLRDHIAMLSPKDVWRIRRQRPGPQARRSSGDELSAGDI